MQAHLLAFISLIPSEFNFDGVFMPPLLVASVFGLLATCLTAMMLNRFRLSRYFFYPPLVYLAMLAIYTLLFGTFVAPF